MMKLSTTIYNKKERTVLNWFDGNNMRVPFELRKVYDSYIISRSLLCNYIKANNML